MIPLRALALALTVTAGPVGAQSTEAPARVVSMNLCTDQFALMLAAPGQLVSVSYVSADPVTSTLAEQAVDYPLNYGSAEQIYLMRPDLVLAHPWSDPTAIAMLRRLGVSVVQVPGVERLADIPDRLAQVGALFGREEQAQTLIRQFETDLAALGTLPPGPRAAFYGANGYSMGEGGMAHEILTRAGFRNIASEVARSDTGQIALELLVMAAPDLILRTARYPGASRSEEILHHPALQALIAAGNGLEMGPDWACGTPRVLEALRDLVEARQIMEGPP
jgi:iron complex transport system substrate-binding protein